MRKKWYRLNISECKCKFATLRVPEEIQNMLGSEWEMSGVTSHYGIECHLHKRAEAVDMGRAL